MIPYSEEAGKLFMVKYTVDQFFPVMSEIKKNGNNVKECSKIHHKECVC